MYLVLVGVLAAAANVAAQAQAIPGLPSCAVSCLSSGFAQAGCSSTDLACQCGDISSAAGTATAACLLSACDLTDILQAQNAVQSMCSSFSATGGVGAAPSTITSVPSVSTGSATATTTRTTTRSTSTTPGASSVAGAQETPATSLSTTGASTPSFTSPTVPAGSSSGNSGGSSSSSGTMIGGIVGGVVGALFLGGLVVWLIMRRRGSTRAAAAITSEEGQQQPAGMPELATTPAGKPMATAWAYPSTPGELPGASISPVSPHGYGYGPPPPWQPPGHQSAELDNAGIGPTELGATSGLPPELSATVYTQPVELGSGNHGYMGGSNTQDQQGRTPQQ